MVVEEDGSDGYSEEDAAVEVVWLGATVKRGQEQERGVHKSPKAMSDPRPYSLRPSGELPAPRARGHWVRGSLH